MIGVLALQGACALHATLLEKSGQPVRGIRRADELTGCDGLVIPGGESTVLNRFLDECRMREALQMFAASHPVFGTCAGAILMASQVNDQRIKPLEIMPMVASRNYYGSQLQSFSAPLRLSFQPQPFTGHFIRAPRLMPSGAVEVLASHEGLPVLLRHRQHLAMSFHPELTDDSSVHRYWLSLFQA